MNGNIPLQDIRSLNEEQLSEWVVALNEKKFRVKQIFEHLWKHNTASFDEMNNLPLSLRDALKKDFSFHKLSIIDKQTSKDGSLKYAFQLSDNQIIETVLIPSNRRSTVCVSSQVGCGLACQFCATAHLGYKRNLQAYEMFEQIFIANEESKLLFGYPITNIVWMGMGEPLLNYEHVVACIHYVSSPKGLGMSKSRITLSTSGITEGIRRLADDDIKIHLALSLHSAHNEQRSTLMPINKTKPLSEVANALMYYHQKTKLRISIEYLLLESVNDSLEHARMLARFCKQFPVKINLIEYNTHPYSNFKPSNTKQTIAFMDYLKSKNLIVTLRQSKGKDIAAACGQLANQTGMDSK